MKNNITQPKKADYTWIIITLCFLSVCTGMGFCSSGRTMYLTAITDALGIERGAFSLNDTIRFITTTVINLFLGTLTNKFGTKKLMCAGFLCLIGFALLNSVAEHLYVFYIAGVLLGIGIAWTGTTMVSVVINKWCNKNKGAITGAILAANGLGGAVAAQVLSPMIFEEGNPFGYRNSYRVVALILSCTLALIIIFFRNNPKGEENSPVSVHKKHKVRGTGWVGMDSSEALKKPYLYITLICMTFTGMSLQGLGGIATPHMYDLGMDKQFVANIMTLSNLCLLGSKFFIGFLYDRIGMKLTMNICFVSSFVSLLGVVFMSDTPIGRTIAVIRIVFSSIALPLETVMLPLFASELFGNKSFEKMVGLFASASTTGFALGSPFANVCFDIFGDYNIPFIVFFCLMLFVTVTMQFVLYKANGDKKIILEQEAKKNEQEIAV